MKQKDPTKFLNDFSNAFGVASAAFQLQDIPKCETAVQMAKSLYKQLEHFTDKFVKTRSEIYWIGSKFFLEILKFNQYNIEFRLSKAEECFNESELICTQGSNIISCFNPTTEEEEDFKVIFGSFFHILSIYIGGLRYVFDAELSYNKGNVTNRSEAYRNAAFKFREIHEVDYIPDPFIIGLTDMIRHFGGLYERRADKLRYDDMDIHYLKPVGKKVFIIHGHDETALRATVQMLTDGLQQEVVVLKDNPNRGNAVIEKFEENAKECGYAIAIVTSDDIVRNKKNRYLQARPNVLFELGWFCGRYGREKVCIIKQKGTEIPSDLGGVICLEFEESINDIKKDLEKELISAGLLA